MIEKTQPYNEIRKTLILKKYSFEHTRKASMDCTNIFERELIHQNNDNNTNIP